ncbi:hypothetical protein SYNTR_1319 [Candidatus Syntrophocurvum alkaliphilum]|uniref:DUF2905 domain-containing protein n=2 Tax=Candidatus Syntrophocurvum alkaliphilum TaxID=2293317 RepID=A0A6I6DG86_9FIRM|nr:hypothetical protein SYNTR_1319 [Candidatus Syntrophocurvum alkaliphilum]
MHLEGLAKLLITIGFLIILMGGMIFILSKLGGAGFKMPGDILIKRENFTFFFPLTTFLILSIVLSILLNIFFRR